MKLLMISGDRSILQGKLGAFFYTLQEMRKHWDRIDVICPHVAESAIGFSESGQRIETGGIQGGEIFFHPCPRRLLFQIPWIVRRGKQLLCEHNHDVMTVHDYPPFYNGIGARRLQKKTGIPYVVEIHHIVGWPIAASLSEWIGCILSKWILPRITLRAKGIRVVNRFVEEELIRFGIDTKKIHTIPSFYLDADVVSSEHKPPVSYDVSFCGRLVKNKRLGALIDAIALLPGVRLLIIGDGPERKAMEEKTQHLHLENRVTFLGWLPSQEAVSSALQTARVFVMNSASEGGPRVALEAMACGMPVIVTKVGVMPEVILDGVNGVFTTGDSVDLAAKIRRLLDDELMCTALAREATKILQTYERSTLIKQYADFLKGIARSI